LLKSCNAKKSEIKPFLEEIIEKTLKNWLFKGTFLLT
jgi:hypothetical protein